jgi:hypothetical protein
MTEFQKFPKIPRLNRDCVVTEKIDGTNAAVVIEAVGPGWEKHEFELARIDLDLTDARELAVFAQSRKRLLKTNEDGGKGSDNFGFAAWVKENALELAAVLGEGRHFGEWYGAGIQRAYGLDHKRFALFNVGRWHDRLANGCGAEVAPDCCSVVPVLAVGAFKPETWDEPLADLRQDGSAAAPGFDNPEGVVVFHSAARQSFKITCEGDESPKGIYKGMHSGEAAA